MTTQARHQAQAQRDYQIRPLAAADEAAIAAVIRIVSAEYGLTPDKGYGVADPTLECLSQVYLGDRARYWVIEHQGQILGGGGIAPLQGNDTVCELQKMYFLPALRGKGLARRLAHIALDFAQQQGFDACYLETTACLKEAIGLYRSLGFVPLTQHLGCTGHDACELPMLLNLREPGKHQDK
jgi:putative acetyltransferase